MRELEKENAMDLERTIISCLLKNPELMKKLFIEDKYFIKNKTLWSFMKSFYKKFKTFDIPLMFSMIIKSDITKMTKCLLIDEITFYQCSLCHLSLFEEYQKQLILLYEDNKKEKFKIEKIYNLANDLLMRLITTEEFEEKYQKIKSNAEIIYNEVTE